MKEDKVETVDFYPTEFSQIPEQDNPAFNGGDCLMIVGEANSKMKNPHAVVLRIKPDPDDSVTNIAKFWSYEDAHDYCDPQ